MTYVFQIPATPNALPDIHLSSRSRINPLYFRNRRAACAFAL